MLINFRSDENGSSPTRGSRASRTSAAQPCLARSDEKRTLGRVTLNGPSFAVLVNGGVARAVSRSECAFELRAERTGDGAASFCPHCAVRRAAGSEYPRLTIPNATSFLYWQETEFGLRPTIRISHVTIRENPEDTVVASKMLYASHYFWTGLELRTLVPDPTRGCGSWFGTVNRSRSDGLSGFTGFFVRRRVRREVENGALAGLRSTKQRLENVR